MGTKNDPGKFDCYHNAAADEPMFILLARDISAPGIVDEWARQRLKDIEAGRKPESDMAMVEEAFQCSDKCVLGERLTGHDDRAEDDGCPL